MHHLIRHPFTTYVLINVVWQEFQEQQFWVHDDALCVKTTMFRTFVKGIV